MLPREESYYVEKLRRLHLTIRDRVRHSLRHQDPATLSEVAREAPEDTIFRLDEGVDDIVLDFCADWGRETSFVLVAEGVEDGPTVFPKGHPAGDADFVLILDPVDGTRPLMYDKRAAWVLSAVATNRGADTRNTDVVVAMQTELPTTRQYLAAHLWAIRGKGYWAESHDVLSGKVNPLHLRPSHAHTLVNGFAGFAKFFPMGKAEAAAIERELFERIGAGDRVFDDQYISTGGQLFELMCGHDRFIADVRPLLVPGALSTHPYDLCTELIALEMGLVLTALDGSPLVFPLDLSTGIGWAGYANEELRRQIAPHLRELLREHARNTSPH